MCLPNPGPRDQTQSLSQAAKNSTMHHVSGPHFTLFPPQTQEEQNVAELPMLQEFPFYSEVKWALSTLIHTKDIKSASHNIIKPAFIQPHSRFYRTGAAGFLADHFSAFSIYPNFPEGVCLQGSSFRSSSCIILYRAQFSTNLENLEEIKEFRYVNIT